MGSTVIVTGIELVTTIWVVLSVSDVEEDDDDDDDVDWEEG